jgi:uncharacterized protein (DUF885 family)
MLDRAPTGNIQCVLQKAMKTKITFLICLLLLTLRPVTGAPAGQKADAEFARIADSFIAGYLQWRPLIATQLGIHDGDGKITDYSGESIRGELERLKRAESAVAAVDAKALSRDIQYDREILLAGIRTELFRIRDLAVYTRNPMTYAGALDLNIYAKRNFAPAEQRLRSVMAIESEAPKIFAAARTNLEASLPRPYIETAIEMAKGAAGFLRRDLTEAFKDTGSAGLREEFGAVNGRAAAELEKFAAWLETEKLPAANNRYALGRETFQKMLVQTELIPESPESLLAIGLKKLKREQQVFADTARLIDSQKKPIDVFKEIQGDHPSEQTLIPETRKDLEGIRQFVIDRKIITVPSDLRANVEETPRYLRATSFASMDTPGPFETRATEAYYYVTPVEPDWSPKQKSEWLTAFNYYTTDVVSIHEVYPGHFVQFLWLKASNPSRISQIFGSYAFIEGWAHYSEQMMLDEGFGKRPGAETRAAAIGAAKFRLAQSDEALLRICRLCVSIKTHCQGLSLEDATRFFEENCYYEHQPAYEEARRGTFDPQYLLYTLGKLQILKLRSDYKNQVGSRFSLEQFHDELLRHGEPPIRLLRERMLHDPKSWGALF